MVIVSRIAGCLEKFLEKILESFLRCGSTPTSIPYFQQHFQYPNNIFNIQTTLPTSTPNTPETIHSQQTHQSTFTYSFDQYLSSSSSDLVNKNKNKRGKNANVARMKNNINTIATKNIFTIIYRLPQTTTQRITMKTERMPILSTHRTFSQLSLSSFNHSLSIHRTNAKRNTNEIAHITSFTRTIHIPNTLIRFVRI